MPTLRQLVPVIALVAGLVAAPPAVAQLQLEVFTADSNGFSVTSTIVYGRTEAILVDAQFRLSDAGKLADRIAATGRRLKAIIITHAHPDHYFGLAVLVQRFPGVPAYISPAGLAEFNRAVGPKIAQWAPVYGAEVPTQVPAPQPLPVGPLTVDGEMLEIVSGLQGDASAPTSSYVWVPSLRAAIVSDIAYDGTHVWLAESNAQTRAAWRATLRLIEARGPSTLVAGHKRRADGPNAPSDMAFTAKYITDFEAALAASRNADELVAAVTKAYPDLGLPIVLTFAAKAAFAP